MAYVRTTKDEYVLLGLYSGTWEELTAEETYKAIKQQLKCYQENEPATPYKIKCNRIKINQGCEPGRLSI